MKEKAFEALMDIILVACGATFYALSKYFGNKNKATS